MKKQINPTIKAYLIRSGVLPPSASGRLRDSIRAGATTGYQASRRPVDVPEAGLCREPPGGCPACHRSDFRQGCRTFLKPGSRSFRRLQMSALLHSRSLAPQHRRANEEAISASFARVAHAFIKGSACLIIQSVLRGVTHRELS